MTEAQPIGAPSAIRRQLGSALPPHVGEPHLFPVGHFAGPVYPHRGAAAPDSFEIRYRDGVFSLSAAEYVMWASAHGEPADLAGSPLTRADAEKAARLAGLDAPGPVLDGLRADGLVAFVPSDVEGARAFAMTHQIRPLALGLGNSPERPGVFEIGMPGAARVSVGYDVYHIWLFAHLAADLWSALAEMAREAADANAEENGEDRPRLVDDPDILLRHVIEALPVLISTSCVYLDRRA
ncbi:hypothetical protein [Phytomonospora endophytica]|uniref:Uncharacterized protein n=1 Tax=Phytomonospora endophytica TaxID=714109 RepID=A0A841FY20_9ACTN|nr:hypothetical protein [Phytomonospora endophytica]MBB6039623.1 hypothetical protein [Phytomonospora endophytica]GIG65658.1 hypothetical protein Pen01_19530 [Phytomonospora endophytica]